MKWMTTSALAVLLAVASSGAVPAEQAAASAPGGPVRINGWALNMSNIATGANQTIRINIDRWSTPAQREHLITTFLEKKQDGLLSELEKQPELGRFNFPGYMGPDPNNTMRLGTDIRYAMNFPGEDGGRRIVIITPRVIGFREESTSRGRPTIRSRCSRCASTSAARAKAGWRTQRRSSSTRRKTLSSWRTIGASQCG